MARSFSNYGWNRLFLNAGDGTFVDQSEVAGVRGKEHLKVQELFFDGGRWRPRFLKAANYVDFSIRDRGEDDPKVAVFIKPADVVKVLYCLNRVMALEDGA
ncbi:MAG: hypothetical protein U0905_06135 [Pirellulales bacterium]